MSDMVGRIVDYEEGMLPDDEVIELFAELVGNGMAWTLQGHYGRMASALIEQGYITQDGEVV
jgi:hypothetical protein